MALGAQRADMLRMTLLQSLRLVLAGIVIGLAGALGATRLMASLLYGVSANDAGAYAAAVFILGAAGLLASYLPARRAMNVALRYE
ncbi:MAG: hypothetical protein M3O82_04155 [Verrucomicrobiota bacterium]|nr:hypothetical protein [Verrucomicrobiota bacterium]